MNFLDSNFSELSDLPRRELITYRVLGVAGVLLIFVFTFVNRIGNPEVVDPIPVRIAMASVVLGLVILTFFYRRYRFRYLVYGALYLTSFWVVGLLYLNRFSVDFALTVLVLTAAFSLVFRSRKQLLWYIITMLAAILLAASAVIQPQIDPVMYMGHVGMISTLSYIVLGARLRTEETLRSREERFRSLIENSSDVITILDGEGKILYESPSIERVLGYRPDELLGRNVFDLVHPEDLPDVTDKFTRVVQNPGLTLAVGLRFRHGNGSWRFMESAGKNLLGHPSLHGVVVNSRDVTERRVVEEELLHNALHDALTGLPNRFLFMERLEHACHRAQRKEHSFAVLFVDLDRFKVINDSLGHQLGDALLVAVARKIQACLRPGDTVARLGGDEFAILLEDVNELMDATRVVERLQEEISAPWSLDGQEVFTSVSIGVVLSSGTEQRREELLRNADMAMYRAKASGRARYEVFDRAMHGQMMERLQMEADLRHALAREELHLHYQPIVALETGRIVGFETLARWDRPGGAVAPAEFIPVAEEAGLILPIGEWVLREACRQLREWQTQFPAEPPLSVSVNLSGRQLSQPDLVEKIEQILRETAPEPATLHLEITESVLMENTESAAAMLSRLRKLGVRVYLDDFGTGYSSLGYLHQLSFDTLKVDRSFVRHLGSTSRDGYLVRSIVDLARNLGVDVIVEGIETTQQLAMIRQLSCRYGQGFLFSGPLDPAGAEKLLGSGASLP